MTAILAVYQPTPHISTWCFGRPFSRGYWKSWIDGDDMISNSMSSIRSFCPRTSRMTNYGRSRSLGCFPRSWR